MKKTAIGKLIIRLYDRAPVSDEEIAKYVGCAYLEFCLLRREYYPGVLRWKESKIREALLKYTSKSPYHFDVVQFCDAIGYLSSYLPYLPGTIPTEKAEREIFAIQLNVIAIINNEYMQRTNIKSIAERFARELLYRERQVSEYGQLTDEEYRKVVSRAALFLRGLAPTA